MPSVGDTIQLIREYELTMQTTLHDYRQLLSELFVWYDRAVKEGTLDDKLLPVERAKRGFETLERRYFGTFERRSNERNRESNI